MIGEIMSENLLTLIRHINLQIQEDKPKEIDTELLKRSGNTHCTHCKKWDQKHVIHKEKNRMSVDFSVSC